MGKASLNRAWVWTCFRATLSRFATSDVTMEFRVFHYSPCIACSASNSLKVNQGYAYGYAPGLVTETVKGSSVCMYPTIAGELAPWASIPPRRGWGGGGGWVGGCGFRLKSLCPNKDSLSSIPPSDSAIKMPGSRVMLHQVVTFLSKSKTVLMEASKGTRWA